MKKYIKAYAESPLERRNLIWDGYAKIKRAYVNEAIFMNHEANVKISEALDLLEDALDILDSSISASSITSSYEVDSEDTYDLELEFDDKLEAALKSKLPGLEQFFGEPSVQGGFGSMFYTFNIDDREYVFEFDYGTQIDDILHHGVDRAVDLYVEKIIAKI